MSNLPAQNERKLPTIQDLFYDNELSLIEEKSKRNELNLLLNHEPNPKWLKEHPIAKRKVPNGKGGYDEKPALFIPIQRVEWLLSRIFIDWYFTVKECKQILNSMVVVGTLYYRDVFSNEYMQQDGVGAAVIITKKDAKALDADSILATAVQMAAPAAKSYAIKDAAECIGKLFGKDMNRSEQMNYEVNSSTFELSIEELQVKLSKLLATCEDQTLVQEIQDIVISIDENNTSLLRECIEDQIVKLVGHGR